VGLVFGSGLGNMQF